MAATPLPPRIEAPAGLVVETFEEAGDAYAVLEWPVAGGLRRTAEREAGLPVPAAQRGVLVLLLAGHSNAEIARRRGRSPRTVAHQVSSLFRRLGVGSRAELFALGARQSRSRESP